ncbi:hypothetical protein [Streptomyces chattanoogensis]|uniref:hypothetical protein n=1 Tax=Streptomyces chattanoogensis TaxID=66876 RepID=UPI0036BB0C86
MGQPETQASAPSAGTTLPQGSPTNAKYQWPDPWLSLNPFFVEAGTVTALAMQGVLHTKCAQVFQTGETKGGASCDGCPLIVHQHQRAAIDAAQSGESHVLTTGSGSGESLSYIVLTWTRC